jgi:uncharacterized protein
MRIEHNPAAHRFVARLPEGHGVLVYRMPSEGVLEVLSTHVPPSARGQGIGGALVEAALTHARVHKLRVIPTCWYVGTWVDRHPEYRELVTE